MIDNLETAREIFRGKVLKAMDSAANEIFGVRVNRNDAGATDDDLPALFRMLDTHLDVLAERFHAPLIRTCQKCGKETARLTEGFCINCK